MFNNMFNASIYMLNMQLVNMPVLNSIFNYDVQKCYIICLICWRRCDICAYIIHMCLCNVYVLHMCQYDMSRLFEVCILLRSMFHLIIQHIVYICKQVSLVIYLVLSPSTCCPGAAFAVSARNLLCCPCPRSALLPPCTLCFSCQGVHPQLPAACRCSRCPCSCAANE